MWRNIVEQGKPQMTIRRMHIVCKITKATHTHTLTIYNTYCFSTATMVARAQLSVMICVHCESCLSSRPPLPAAYFAVHFVCCIIYTKVPLKKWEIFNSMTFRGRVVYYLGMWQCC
jgi:hypothetical protein